MGRHRTAGHPHLVKLAWPGLLSYYAPDPDGVPVLRHYLQPLLRPDPDPVDRPAFPAWETQFPARRVAVENRITRIHYATHAPPAFNGAAGALASLVALLALASGERWPMRGQMLSSAIPPAWPARWWDRRGAGGGKAGILRAAERDSDCIGQRIATTPIKPSLPAVIDPVWACRTGQRAPGTRKRPCTDEPTALAVLSAARSAWEASKLEAREREQRQERAARTADARAAAKSVGEFYDATRGALGGQDLRKILRAERLVAPRERITKHHVIELDPAPSYALPPLKPGQYPQAIGEWSLQPLPTLVDDDDHERAREWMAENFPSADSAQPHGPISIPYEGDGHGVQNAAEWTEDVAYCAGTFGREKIADGFKIKAPGRARALRELGRVRRRSRLPRDPNGRCTIPLPDLQEVLSRYAPDLHWAPLLAFAVLVRLCAPPEMAKPGMPRTPDGHAKVTAWGGYTPRELCGVDCPDHITTAVVYWIHGSITPRSRGGGTRRNIHAIVKVLLDRDAVARLVPDVELDRPEDRALPETVRPFTRGAVKPSQLPAAQYCNCHVCRFVKPQNHKPCNPGLMWEAPPSWWPTIGVSFVPEHFDRVDVFKGVDVLTGNRARRWSPKAEWRVGPHLDEKNVMDAQAFLATTAQAPETDGHAAAKRQEILRRGRARTMPNVIELCPPYTMGEHVDSESKSQKETGT